MKKFLLVVVIIVIVAAGLLYGAPKFILSGGKTVEVTTTESDYNSGMQKLNVKVASMDVLNLTSLAEKKFKTTGTVNVDNTFSNEEMSAVISKANETNGPIKDFKVDFIGDGQGQVSFSLSDKAIDYVRKSEIIKGIKIPGVTLAIGNVSYVSLNDYLAGYISSLANNASVYAKGSLIKTSANNVSIDIQELTVGSITMSADVISKVEAGTIQFVNALITSDNGFSIEELRVEDGILYYKGTLPAEITEN